jgi:hypothetical protein
LECVGPSSAGDRRFVSCNLETKQGRKLLTGMKFDYPIPDIDIRPIVKILPEFLELMEYITNRALHGK